MTNCTITLDVTGFGYTYLLQLDSMLGDFLEDGDNAAAADTLHDWMLENARNFADDAHANGDTLAADIFSDLAAEDEDADEPDEDDAAPADEGPANAYEADAIATGNEGFWMYTKMAVQAYLDAPENENLERALQANATDVRNNPGNLFRAGVFEGLAEAAAWQIYGSDNAPDDINAITAAIYKAYGVAW